MTALKQLLSGAGTALGASIQVYNSKVQGFLFVEQSNCCPWLCQTLTPRPVPSSATGCACCPTPAAAVVATAGLLQVLAAA